MLDKWWPRGNPGILNWPMHHCASNCINDCGAIFTGILNLATLLCKWWVRANTLAVQVMTEGQHLPKAGVCKNKKTYERFFLFWSLLNRWWVSSSRIKKPFPKRHTYTYKYIYTLSIGASFAVWAGRCHKSTHLHCQVLVWKLLSKWTRPGTYYGRPCQKKSDIKILFAFFFSTTPTSQIMELTIYRWNTLKHYHKTSTWVNRHLNIKSYSH